MEHIWILIVAMLGHILNVYCDRLLFCTPSGKFNMPDLKDKPDMLFYYEEILKKEHDPGADIRVEKINGPVLLISGDADVMVPSNWVCGQIMNRLDENGFKYPHAHKNYELLSHYAAMFRPMSSGLFRVERKYRKECDANREASWKYTLEFLQNEWVMRQGNDKEIGGINDAI